MEAVHKKILQRRTKYFQDNLLMSPDLYGSLFAMEVFTRDTTEEIKTKGTNSEQILALMIRLQTCGPNAFHLFLTCLDESENGELADVLRKDEVDKTGTIDDRVKQFLNSKLPRLMTKVISREEERTLIGAIVCRKDFEKEKQAKEEEIESNKDLQLRLDNALQDAMQATHLNTTHIHQQKDRIHQLEEINKDLHNKCQKMAEQTDDYETKCERLQSKISEVESLSKKLSEMDKLLITSTATDNGIKEQLVEKDSLLQRMENKLNTQIKSHDEKQRRQNNEICDMNQNILEITQLDVPDQTAPELDPEDNLSVLKSSMKAVKTMIDNHEKQLDEANRIIELLREEEEHIVEILGLERSSSESLPETIERFVDESNEERRKLAEDMKKLKQSLRKANQKHKKLEMDKQSLKQKVQELTQKWFHADRPTTCSSSTSDKRRSDPIYHYDNTYTYDNPSVESTLPPIQTGLKKSFSESNVQRADTNFQIQGEHMELRRSDGQGHRKSRHMSINEDHTCMSHQISRARFY